MTAGAWMPAGTRRRRGGRLGRAVAVVVDVRAGAPPARWRASDARMPWPSDVPRCGVSRSIAARTVAWSLVGCWTATPAIAEGDDADDDARPAGAATKSVAAAMAAVHAGRREVRGGHAGRDVEGEDDRAFLARHVDRALRPREGDDHHGDARAGTAPPARRRGATTAPRRAGRGERGAASRSRDSTLRAERRRTHRMPRPCAAGAGRWPDRPATRAGRGAAEQGLGPGEGHRLTSVVGDGGSPCGRSPGRGPRRSTATPPRRRPAGTPRRSPPHASRAAASKRRRNAGSAVST